MAKKPQNKGGHVLGVISDTHGTLTPEAVRALKKVDFIIHAGDIDSPDVLTALSDIAPVTAVRGNMDRGGWTKDLSRTQVVAIGGIAIYVLHDVNMLDLDPASAGFKAVVSGHTHRPSIEKRNGVLYINPGSAWWPRANYPATIAMVTLKEKDIAARLVDLES
jgi:uncharacterized protein